MFVIGTAGHVDHGKSTLIKALTGIDPDRLQEEQERGMTIDLGFAWLRLPSGKEVSIVDVPGHERFIKNMLAGVGGIDIALLVVAADEGVMPQTREHLDILNLLRIRSGVVAITKKDLVEDEWLQLVADEVTSVLKGTVLGDAPIIPLSVITGEGLPDLISCLDSLLDSATPKSDTGRPRLPIDRVFTVAGFGTVVTGTLIDGRLQVGQEVEIQPKGLRSRVRGLQTHRQRVETAIPGSRVAVNLTGVEREGLERGDVVTSPGWLIPTSVVDARLQVLPSAQKPLAHNTTLSFHIGSAESQVRVRLLDTDQLEPGQAGWTQLRLDRALAIAKGDLFVVRTPNISVGGGEVIDVTPKRHRRFHSDTIASLETLAVGSPEEIVLQVLQNKMPLELAAIARLSNLSESSTQGTLNNLLATSRVVSVNGLITTSEGWTALKDKVLDFLKVYHGLYPLRLGMAKEELRSRLVLSGKLFSAVMGKLVEEGYIAEEGSLVRLREHQVELTPQQREKVQRLLETLHTNPYTPPNRSELEQQFNIERTLVDALIEQRQLVKVSDEVLYPADVYQEIVDKVVAYIREKGSITVGEVRDLLGASRKYALALMEHLDEEKITRRVGDSRILR